MNSHIIQLLITYTYYIQNNREWGLILYQFLYKARQMSILNFNRDVREFGKFANSPRRGHKSARFSAIRRAFLSLAASGFR